MFDKIEKTSIEYNILNPKKTQNFSRNEIDMDF